MAAYNVNFELSIDDVELIENALRQFKKDLSAELIGSDTSHNESVPDGRDIDGMLRQIHDLLGHLHNQKVFYRPRSGAYIGG